MRRYSIEEKQEVFQKILEEFKKNGVSKTSIIKIKEIAKDYYKCSITDVEITKLNVRKILLENGIVLNNMHPEEKEKFFENFLQHLLEKKITVITNAEIMNLMRSEFGINLQEEEIKKLGLRNLLQNVGIEPKQSSTTIKIVIDKTLDYIKKENITIESVAKLHKIAEKFGKISRGSIDNHLDYIQQHINIKNIKDNKRIKALDKSDENILIEVAKYYSKKNIFKITASEIRKHTNSRYRTVDIAVIKSYRQFFKDNYDIEIITQDTMQKDQSYQIEEIQNYLKNSTMRYKIKEIINFDDLKQDDNFENDVFIATVGLQNKLEAYWKIYIKNYIYWLAQNRINVYNGLMNNDGTLKIDTEKKQLIMLCHEKLSAKDMTFKDYINLSMRISKSSNKSYGIHLQNMYIGFLLFLYSKNEIIIPFSYIFDVCYSGKKVQSELPFFLSSHPINIKLLQYIKEKRLSVKDDKYKRIFQFFLLSLPINYALESITFANFSLLLDRNKSDFKRVIEIFNNLGANIVIEKVKMKYTDKYNMYKKIKKYSKLVELFNKTMDRVYKLGDYSKEENVYKVWSAQYAFFFDFIEQNYSNKSLSETFLYQIFDYPDEEKILTYQEYIQEQKASSATKSKRFTPLIMAFAENTLYQSLKNLKDKIPVFESTNDESTKNQYRGPILNPIILTKLEDILRNRPPKSNYYNNEIEVTEEHKKWWKHFGNVAPFEPLILLAHLYIPARGINFRLADCDSFLVKDEKAKTTGYHFTHDKNKKRKTPYVAPNIWGNRLEIIEELTRYVKFHFPNLKLIKYDKQNSNGILPLFPNKKGENFYSEGQHMKYWTRVLLKAQIELNNENNEENILLIFPTSCREIPKDPADVDKLSQKDMKDFQIRYDLHSLRHTGATKYANAGMPLGLLALLTGHIDMNVLQDVYIQLNAQKMIEMWKDTEDINIGDSTLAEAGKKFIHHTETIAKEALHENSPEKLLKFLEERNFISIGSYLNKDELTLYELEDFAKIDPVFWSFRRHGICTSAQCPQGLENRCSLCPHFTTSPVYIQEIAMYINLQNFRLSKYGNMIIENRKKGNPEDNENIRKSAQMEMEEMLGWIKILQALDEVRLMVNEEDDVIKNDNKDLTVQDMKEMSIFSLAPIVNSDHSLLKLVYDSIELKEFEHESFQDASEKLVSKIIRYAARNNCFDEIDGRDKYQIFEWFKPVYNEVLSLEKDNKQKDKLENILSLLSDKSSGNKIGSKKMLLLDNEEEK